MTIANEYLIPETPQSGFDALLVLSFGGPEGNDEVLPFLQNVTRGRGIPDERLKEVGEHYYANDGISPINAQNKQLIANVEEVLKERGRDLPVYFGNRNWYPFGEEAAKQIAEDGHENVLVFATSAWGGYSACLQYDEDIRRLKEAQPELTFTKLRQFYDHPDFIGDMAESLVETLNEVPADRRDATRVLFTAHSVPTQADNESGGEGDKNLYSRQVEEASRLIAEAAKVDNYDLVWQSRSGNPATPWLEPDIVDHTEAIADSDNVRSVVVVPVGFITDHMEVIWDLDTEVKEAAEELDITYHRTRTSGLEMRFARMVVDLIDELEQQKEPIGLGSVSVMGCTVDGQACRPGCCSSL